MCSPTAFRRVAPALIVALGLVLLSCDDAQRAVSTTPSTTAFPTTTPFDDRFENVGTVTASAGALRFIGEILGLYLAPAVDDWPQALREERERTIAGGCINEPTAQSNLDFTQPLNIPSEFEPAGYLESTGTPEVVACSGRAAGLNFEYRKNNDDGTTATVLLSRRVVRADTFDAAVGEVSARTIGARQAVVIAPSDAGALAQRSMVLFPEDFGATTIRAYNLSRADLLAFAASVAVASAPFWEKNPQGLGTDRSVRVCADIPAGATSDHAAFGFTDDGRTSEMIFLYANTALVLYPGDGLDGCPDVVRQSLAFGGDPTLYYAARTWVATQRGELAGECATRPLIPGQDPALADWCFYRPRREGNDVVLSVGRPQSDYAVDLAMRPSGGKYQLLEVVTPATDNLRLWYFQDEHAFRWSTYQGAAAYRLDARLVATREHAADPCIAPPLVEETREIALAATLPPEAHWYFIDLPELPPEDAWYVTIVDNNGGGPVLHALDARGAVIAEAGTNWVRDLFCTKPTVVPSRSNPSAG